MRRDARRAASRAEILDAAETVFGERGPRAGSLRDIAQRSGFSTAAIYLFFDNKQHLLAETLRRRGEELVPLLASAAAEDLPPIGRLHLVVDVTVEFFARRPDFRRLLRHITGGDMVTGPVLGEFAGDVQGRFAEAMSVLVSIIEAGQAAGEIRDGDAAALAHFFSVLCNEFVLLPTDGLTAEQFHGLIDGAFRRPATIDD